MQNELLVRAEGLSYAYPFCRENAIADISFELRRGEVLLVTGASGCGKSTILRIVNGLIPGHFRGRLSGTIEIRGREIGTVMQVPEEQILATTVEEEVALALEWREVPSPEIRRRVDDALRVLDLSALATRSVFELSSGERQKCVLAAVLAARADIVVMDEPTANLSPEATEELATLVADLKRRGIAVVVVDHRLYWLGGVVDRVLILEKGRLAATCGSLAAVDSRFGLRVTKVGRVELPPVAQATEEPLLAIDGLRFRYARRLPFLYADFSATVPRGRITALTGANGAGKTTLARLVCGLLKPQAGTIRFGGRVLRPARLRARTAFVMQQMDIQLYMRTVREELMFSAPRGISKDARRRDAERHLRVFGLAKLADRHPHSLSGGEKQRLVIACALMKRPELMILDEPTSGLDGANMRMIARVLLDYAASGGTVLLITHDLELLALAAHYSLEIKSA